MSELTNDIGGDGATPGRVAVTGSEAGCQVDFADDGRRICGRREAYAGRDRMTDREPGLWAGQQLGRYRLGRLIGRGSMGEVYEAEDTIRERTIALKLLWADLSRDSGFRDRMQREARTAGRLQEPHVVPIHDYGDIDGHLFLDMRLIRGSDLAAVLKRSGPLTASRAVGLVQQAASALDAAHAEGVIHRDIKPANLLLTEEDFLYLADFGIASAVGDEPLEVPKTIEGTWKYSAPELFSGSGVGGSVDIYALTAVLYECLTGKPPYQADDVQGLIEAHLNDPVPQASQAPGVALAFDAVIARGLAKSAEDRYATAGELAKAAQKALNAPVPGRPAAAGGSAPGAPSAAVGHQLGPLAVPVPPAGLPPGRVSPAAPALPRSGPHESRVGAHPGGWAGTQEVVRTGFYWDWRLHGPRLGAAAAALVLVIALIAWMTSGGNDGDQSTDSGGVATGGGQTAGVEQLRKAIPAGYPEGTCTIAERPAGVVAQLVCGRNSDSGGPVSATYSLYADREALRAGFQERVNRSAVELCPGRIQSPGPWHRATTPPDDTDGMLLCGFRQGIPRIVWTTDVDLVLNDVQADERAVVLDQLFSWWRVHS